MKSDCQPARPGPAPDVVVVGGGTAGLFTAYLLAQGGARVRLYEANERLGPPERTLIITSRLADALGFEPTPAVLNRTPVLELHSPGCRATVTLRESDLIVERAALVELLAERAATAGVEICPGRRFLALEPDSTGLTLILEDGRGRRERATARALVGADGVDSIVAAAAGITRARSVSLLQAQVDLPAWCPCDTAQVWFQPRLTRFFFWLEPDLPGRGTVGLIADDPHTAREALGCFLAEHDLAPLGYQGAQIPYHARRVRPWCDRPEGRVLLVGDAAGQVKMTTVGGVVTGLRGAAAAARAILGDSSYGRALAPLHRELDLHLLVHRIVSRAADAEYDAMLALVRGRTQRLLGAHSRDEIARVLLPSLLAQPRFLLVALRCLRRAPRPAAEHGVARGRVGQGLDVRPSDLER